MYNLHDYRCFACGVHCDESQGISGRLDAHEDYRYNYINCTITLKRIVALCTLCHSYIHQGRMNALYDKGVIDESECEFIINHGERVLTGEGHIEMRMIAPEFHDEDWLNWCVVLRFYSKFKNRQEWEDHYNKEE